MTTQAPQTATAGVPAALPSPPVLHKNRDALLWSVAKAVTSSRVPRTTPHDLGHTAASLAVSAGANVKAVQKIDYDPEAVATDQARSRENWDFRNPSPHPR